MCAQAVEHCIVAAARRPAAAPSRSRTCDSISEPAQASAGCSSSFEAAVLTRLARRGHAALIAHTVWKAIRDAPAAHVVDARHASGADHGSSGGDGAATSLNDAGSTADEEAISDRRASHAEASTAQCSHTTTGTGSRQHPSRKGVASCLHLVPSAGEDVCSETAETDESIAAREQRDGEGVDIVGRLLCQLADTQALEKILAALLLEAPASESHVVAQVTHWRMNIAWTDCGVAIICPQVHSEMRIMTAMVMRCLSCVILGVHLLLILQVLEQLLNGSLWQRHCVRHAISHALRSDTNILCRPLMSLHLCLALPVIVCLQLGTAASDWRLVQVSL